MAGTQETHRKVAVNFVSSSPFFIYVLTQIINRQFNLNPKEWLIHLFKTIHYHEYDLTPGLQEACRACDKDAV